MSQGKTGEYFPQNMDLKLNLLSTISRFFILGEKRLVFRRRNLKIILFLVFLTPYALFFFSITTDIRIE
jgi:hypothetical protein